MRHLTEAEDRPAAVTTSGRELTADDLARLRRIAEATIAPDGRLLSIFEPPLGDLEG